MRKDFREAIMEFYDRLRRLSDRERSTMLRTFDEMVSKKSLHVAPLR